MEGGNQWRGGRNDGDGGGNRWRVGEGNDVAKAINVMTQCENNSRKSIISVMAL